MSTFPSEVPYPYADSYVQTHAILNYPGYFLVEWFWQTNTNITAFDIHFSSDKHNLKESICDVVATEFSSEEICYRFQPGPHEYIPAHALAVYEEETGGLREGQDEDPVFCTLPSANAKAAENPCPATAGITCYKEGETVKFDKEVIFKYAIDCSELGGKLQTEKGTFCKESVKDGFFKFYVSCDLFPIAWGSGLNNAPNLVIETSADATVQSAEVKSDPHFNGFRGQTYDVTGTPGKIYSLISDETFLLNAKFAQAYTTGLHIDPTTGEVRTMSPKGTWISAVALKTCKSETDSDKLDWTSFSMFPRAPDPDDEGSKEVLKFATVEVDGEPITTFHGGKLAVTDTVTLSIKNRSSYSRVSFSSPEMTADFDAVMPPAEWDVKHDVERYMHINLKIQSIVLSDKCHGLMGVSNRAATVSVLHIQPQWQECGPCAVGAPC